MREGETITVKIRRQEPGAEPRFVTYQVPYEKHMRILDALAAISASGESVAFRYFCSSKKCGACAMKVNGVPRLTCWEPVEQNSVIEPLDNFPVVRDLVVDREAYQRRCLDFDPYVERSATPPFPEPLKHGEMLGSYSLTGCIECGICTSACPAYTGAQGAFPGPWALVQAAKFARDPRDERDRRAVLEENGVDNCMSCCRCEEVCPVGVPIVSEAIEPLRGMAARGPAGKAAFPLAFAQNVRENAYVNSAALYVGTQSAAKIAKSLPLALQMFSRGKTRMRHTVDEAARRAIAALFREAGEREVK